MNHSTNTLLPVHTLKVWQFPDMSQILHDFVKNKLIYLTHTYQTSQMYEMLSPSTGSLFHDVAFLSTHRASGN